MIIEPSTRATIHSGLSQTTQDLEWYDDAAAQLVTVHWSEAGCFQTHFGLQFQDAEPLETAMSRKRCS
jgi:hypothetical protein